MLFHPLSIGWTALHCGLVVGCLVPLLGSHSACHLLQKLTSRTSSKRNHNSEPTKLTTSSPCCPEGPGRCYLGKEKEGRPTLWEVIAACKVLFRALHGSLLKWMSPASTVCHRNGECETFWADVTCPGTNHQEVNSKHHVTSIITTFFLLNFLFSFSKFC